jgi:non-ribosomal peptide synthetase-like protein
MLFGLWIFVTGFQWATATDSVVDIYWRSAALGAGLLVALTMVPVAAKWLLIGRFRAQSIPIWSFAYFRFWVVKTLIRTSPAAAFIGTPLYNAYLRILGARIGRNVVLRCKFAPVCTDLVTIGDNTIVRNETSLLGYRAQSNFIHMGPVTIGRNAFVGEGSALDIDTSMGDNTQLGHSSSLQSGQRVPDGKHYHGSPAVETSSDYCPIEGKNHRAELRGTIYVSLILAATLMLAAPAVLILINYVWHQFCPSNLGSLHCPFISSMPTSLLLALSAALYFGAIGLGLAAMYVIPRICMMGLRPGVTYANFGFHYLLQSIIRRVSNSVFFNTLFGDSSAIVWYMRYVGWNLNKVYQTGSNIGNNQKHDNPFLCNIGSGTMVSDWLKMINMHMSPTSFRLAESKIGDNNFLGNFISYPPDGRTGSNVLLGTKTLVPIDGPVHENVGLLGSPAFEIPRKVCRDNDVNTSFDEQTRRTRVRRKNKYNFVTASIFLASQWVVLCVALLLGQAAFANYDRFYYLGFFTAIVGDIVFTVVFFILVERAFMGFKRLKPQIASIYDPYFWWHERYWKLMTNAFPILAMIAGTPLRGMLLRIMGMKVGAKLFDCSYTITERSLTEVGDYVNLNEGCVLEGHSLEEAVFKSDYIRLGSRCSIGPKAVVHYGVSTGDDVVLDADSFLMKGEILDSHTEWRGNPAKMVRRHAVQDEVYMPMQDVSLDTTVRSKFASNELQGQVQEGGRQ